MICRFFSYFPSDMFPRAYSKVSGCHELCEKCLSFMRRKSIIKESILNQLVFVCIFNCHIFELLMYLCMLRGVAWVWLWVRVCVFEEKIVVVTQHKAGKDIYTRSPIYVYTSMCVWVCLSFCLSVCLSMLLRKTSISSLEQKSNYLLSMKNHPKLCKHIYS